MTAKERFKKIDKVLKKRYPDAKCSLDYKTPLQLLIATILSAQCTDERVNKVTIPLFKKYRKAKDFADATIEELETDVRSTGFYKNKAKSIKSCCESIAKNHKGKVPATLEELVQLAGVGRKTANVVLGNAFDIPGITVDTHVGRISKRLGLTNEKNPVKVERDLMDVIPQKDWTHACHRIILFGRDVCSARKPNCLDCPIEKLCPWEATD